MHSIDPRRPRRHVPVARPAPARGDRRRRPARGRRPRRRARRRTSPPPLRRSASRPLPMPWPRRSSGARPTSGTTPTLASAASRGARLQPRGAAPPRLAAAALPARRRERRSESSATSARQRRRGRPALGVVLDQVLDDASPSTASTSTRPRRRRVLGRVAQHPPRRPAAQPAPHLLRRGVADREADGLLGPTSASFSSTCIRQPEVNEITRDDA